MTFIFPAPDQISLPIIGSDDRFPVNRIYCVGRNYADHVVEMGGDLKTSSPVIFVKDASRVVESGRTIPYPAATADLHHEIELVVAMGKDGIFGYGVGLDMTRRDLQHAAKAKKGPWDRAKNFPQSAACGAITPADQVDISAAKIDLTVNGAVRQSSMINKMIWAVPTIIEFLKADMGLAPGDLIYTGTPEGVGPVVAGDKLVGTVEGLETLSVTYV